MIILFTSSPGNTLKDLAWSGAAEEEGGSDQTRDEGRPPLGPDVVGGHNDITSDEAGPTSTLNLHPTLSQDLSWLVYLIWRVFFYWDLESIVFSFLILKNSFTRRDILSKRTTQSCLMSKDFQYIHYLVFPNLRGEGVVIGLLWILIYWIEQKLYPLASSSRFKAL